jgi:manganese/zinc/iron transport system permease protein
VNLLHDLLFDYTLRTVALGAGALGAVSGALGSFAVLRRQSLLGDAISHAALPGIVLAFMLTGTKSVLVLVIGAAIAGWLGTLLVIGITSATRIPQDSALGIVLSVFFGVGLVLLTYVQKMPTAAQAGLDRFLFGQAATLVGRDVARIAGIGALVVAAVAVFWKELKILSFDREYGASLGFPMRGIEVLLTTLLVIAIVIGLQTVGVVLMAAMVVAPGAAARQWTDSLGRMVVLAAAFGAVAGIGGAVASGAYAKLPTGPSVVLAATVLVVVSLLLAPGRGVLWASLNQRRNRRRIRADAVLTDLYALSRQHVGEEHGHREEVLHAMEAGRVGVGRTLAVLEARGFVRQLPDRTWTLTDEGRDAARTALAAHAPDNGDGGAL